MRWADSSPGGAIDTNLDFVPDFTGEGGVYDPGNYVPGTPFTIGGSSTPQDSYFGDYTPYTKRHIANLLTSFKVSPALRLFAEGKFVRTYARTASQPTYDFYTYLNPDNAYLNAKFPDAVKAATGFVPALPQRLAGLYEGVERLSVLANDKALVRAHIEARLALP